MDIELKIHKNEDSKYIINLPKILQVVLHSKLTNFLFFY